VSPSDSGPPGSGRDCFDRRGRIAARFAQLKAEGRGALMPYLEAYDPDPATSMALLRGLPGAGADLIELGVPFSDPMADGPTIQLAAQRALKAGGSLAGALAMVRDFRRADDDTPVVLMGYLNPILSYGIDSFCTEAACSGVDGLIVVDLPPEEADELAIPAREQGLDLIRLVAPTTDEARLPKVLEGTSGFIYYVAIAGITGTRSATRDALAEAIPRLRRHTDLPIAIGFGVRSPQQAAEAAQVADGAVVASALIDTLAQSLDERGRARPETLRRVLDQVRGLADAVRGARVSA
jgi:tryptophan synthase alpha chain